MASLDEEIKRQYLQGLANAGSELAFQQERNQFTPQQIARFDMQDALVKSRDKADLAMRLRQDASTMQAPAIIPPRQDFLTPSGKGGVMDFVKGILSSRLQSKGLRRDPLDVARQNAVNRQRFDDEVSSLNRQAEAASALSDSMRAQAVANAMQIDPTINPVQGLPATDRLQNRIVRTGRGFDPAQDFELGKKQLDFINADNAILQAEALQARGVLNQTQVDAVKNASIDERVNILLNLEYDESLGGGLIRRRKVSGEVTQEPDQDTLVLQDFYGFAATKGMVDNRKATLKSLQESNSPTRQLQRTENALRYREIIPHLTKAALTGDPTITDDIFGRFPDFLRDLVNPNSRNVQSIAQAIAQQSLREFLGGQFAVQENVQLTERFFDVKLPPIFNLARIRRSERINKALALEVERLEEHMRVYGFLENGPKDENGRPQGFRKKKMSELLEELNISQNPLEDLLSEFEGDAGTKQLMSFADAKNPALNDEYNGVSVKRLLVDELIKRRQKKEREGS